MAQHHWSKDSLIWIQGCSCCWMLIYGPEKLWLNFIPIIYNCSHHISVKTSFLYSFAIKKWDTFGWGHWIWACVRGHKNDRDWSPRVSVVNTAQLCKWAKMRLATTQHAITYIIEAERLCSSAFLIRSIVWCFSYTMDRPESSLTTWQRLCVVCIDFATLVFTRHFIHSRFSIFPNFFFFVSVTAPSRSSSSWLIVTCPVTNYMWLIRLCRFKFRHWKV